MPRREMTKEEKKALGLVVVGLGSLMGSILCGCNLVVALVEADIAQICFSSVMLCVCLAVCAYSLCKMEKKEKPPRPEVFITMPNPGPTRNYCGY